MFRPAAAIAAAAFLSAAAAGAEEFDYYVLSLSWSPTWCLEAGPDDAGAQEQCAPERDLEFVLHGLWPQDEVGWPEYCRTTKRDPSRRETAAMADVMGTSGLAWHQWKKHGRCSGLEAEDYFALSRFAFGLIAKPELAPRMTARDVEAAFVAANPGLSEDAAIVTCRDGRLDELRVCLTRDALDPRPCGDDVLRGACRARGALDVPEPE